MLFLVIFLMAGIWLDRFVRWRRWESGKFERSKVYRNQKIATMQFFDTFIEIVATSLELFLNNVTVHASVWIIIQRRIRIRQYQAYGSIYSRTLVYLNSWLVLFFASSLFICELTVHFFYFIVSYFVPWNTFSFIFTTYVSNNYYWLDKFLLYYSLWCFTNVFGFPAKWF